MLVGCDGFWNAPQGSTASTTTLTSSTVSPAEGASVTLTATISPSAATGTVTFYNGSTSLGTGTLSSGTATLSTSFSTAGTFSVKATYGGDSTYASSTSSALSIAVTGQTASATTLTPSSLSPALGASVNLTASISPSSATGTVAFSNGTASLGTQTLSSGTAVQSTQFWTSGNQSITAAYSGDTTYAPSTSSEVTIDVGSPGSTPSSVSLSASSNSVNTGDTVNLLATVNPASATGQITFYDGTTVLGTSMLGSSGTATLSPAFSTTGSHSLTVRYSGDPTYAAAISATFTLTVN
jgi:uncharacterized protein YjdB